MLRSYAKQRLLWIMLSVGLVLLAYYLAVYRPLAARADAYDEQLLQTWRKLAVQTPGKTAEGPDMDRISQRLLQVRKDLERLHEVRRQISERLKLEPELRERARQPFQLVEFQNDREKRIENLTQFAKQQNVTLDPAALTGFPAFATDLETPAFLWRQLALLDHLLQSAVRCHVTAIKSADLGIVRACGKHPGCPLQIPARVSLVGSMTSISDFLHSLPLVPGEIAELKLPEAQPAKPALFIDRLFLRKESADNPDLVRLDLRVSGLSYLESASTNISEHARQP